MTKIPITSIAATFLLMTLLLHHVNSRPIGVTSSHSFTNCDEMSCSSGSSCAISHISIGDTATKVKFCSDIAGHYRKETIVTTLIGNKECITNTTDVNGKVTSTKQCKELSETELESRREMLAANEKLQKLMATWEKRQEEMERIQEKHEMALEREMQEREKAWDLQQEALDRQLEKLKAPFWIF